MRAFILPVLAGTLLASTAAAKAADAVQNAAPTPPPAEIASNWALQVTPYVWAAGLDGDVSPFARGPTIGVNKSFSDILDHLNVGGFINVWARYDRFVFSGDLMYVDTTDSRSSGPLPVIGAVSGSLDTKEFTSTLELGYRLYSSPRFTLDALAGARIWHISNDLRVRAGPLSRSFSEDFSWVDPVIGARIFYRISDRFSLQAQADVGGFGVASKNTWQALATVNYAFTKNLSVSAGYKVLEVNYRSDGHVFDTTLQGPVLGMTYRF
jgi:hypothetical protein